MYTCSKDSFNSFFFADVTFYEGGVVKKEKKMAQGIMITYFSSFFQKKKKNKNLRSKAKPRVCECEQRHNKVLRHSHKTKHTINECSN